MFTWNKVIKDGLSECTPIASCFPLSQQGRATFSLPSIPVTQTLQNSRLHPQSQLQPPSAFCCSWIWGLTSVLDLAHHILQRNCITRGIEVIISLKSDSFLTMTSGLLPWSCSHSDLGVLQVTFLFILHQIRLFHENPFTIIIFGYVLYYFSTTENWFENYNVVLLSSPFHFFIHLFFQHHFYLLLFD